MRNLLAILTKWSPYIWFASSVLGLLLTAELIRRLRAVRALSTSDGVSTATSLLIWQAWSRLILLAMFTVVGFLALINQADKTSAPILQLVVLLILLAGPPMLGASSYSGLRYGRRS